MAEDREVERRAQAGAERSGGARAARELLAREKVAALATLSQRHPGFPSGSLVPYALDARGAPLLLLSALAQHARNLAADPRASLLVFDGAAAQEDPRTAARVSLVGRVVPVAADAEPDARARYLARHPSARGLLAMDFALFVLEVEEAQFVGGFASAGFFSGAELAAAG